MAERHKREAKLNRGRKAKNKGREVLPNTKKSTSTEVINQEHKEIIKWFQTVKFRRTLFGGVDENDVWKKLQELNQLYESAIRAERERLRHRGERACHGGCEYVWHRWPLRG